MVAYSFQRRFVVPIFLGLGRDLIELPQGFTVGAGLPLRPKRHTIRENGPRRHARPGEVLQLYYAQRTKQCFKIGIASCTKARDIAIRIGTAGGDMGFKIEGKTLRAPQADAFALSDGFDSVEDMWSFWRQNHPKVSSFSGTIIDWKAT